MQAPLRRAWAVFVAVALLFTVTGSAVADHSWGSYHWARTANPFTLKLGDNVDSKWDAYLAEASGDWSASSVLDTTVVPGGTNPKRCRPTVGQAEVCAARYGFNGWLGLAQIWVKGSHITQAITKLNDSYFDTATYNNPEWRRFVMCQEIGHTFGLDHQDETFNNTNLGSCMDYTNDPNGPPSNEHPNKHDYDQLASIYSHLDSTTTVGTSTSSKGSRAEGASDWGRLVASGKGGRTAVYLKELGPGQRIITFVIWA